MTKNNIIIIGCGYIGQKLALEYQSMNKQVLGIVKSQATKDHLQELGITADTFDFDSVPNQTIDISHSQAFVLMPPPSTGTEDSRISNMLKWFSQTDSPERLVYISTTGVYGDCQGEWVDESHPVNPSVDRTKRRWSAETQLRQWQQNTGKELVILRVAGIYGPNKLPLARLQQQAPMVREDQAPFTNRIHADDLVQICIAAMDKGKNSEVYHACDGQEDNMTNYFNQIADKFNLPRPKQISLDEAKTVLSAGMMSYMKESRRLKNDKLKELGVVLKYPDLASGLQQCFQEMNHKQSV